MNDKAFFGPLSFNKTENTKQSVLKCTEEQEVICILCDEEIFNLPECEQRLLTHLFMQHRLVIADVNLISDLKAYISYWKLRLRDGTIKDFCTTMILNEKPDGSKSDNEEYFLLSDVLPEDKELRAKLQQDRLEELLLKHQFEREDKNYERECLFCRNKEKDTRANFLKHLYEKHNFHIAKPENLIFVDDLIELISKKLQNLKCIFCEKTFKDRMILKEHMRKKGHKRINPLNKEYDKYFLVNYLEAGKNQYKPQKHKTITKKTYSHCKNTNDKNSCHSNEDSDPDWSDWIERDSPKITCLFCNYEVCEYNAINEHMICSHNFNFNAITDKLSFYHKIKIVNYIRRQILLKQCISCGLKFNEDANLRKHIHDAKHITLDKTQWDQPEFYFPTYEDDLFLCFIQDEDESWWSGDEKQANNEYVDEISKEMALSVLIE